MNKRCIYCQRVSNVAEDTIDCPACGLANKLTPFVSMPMLNASTAREFEAYESPATGKVITSHQARKYDMQASGCRDWEGVEQEKKYAAKAKIEEDQRQEQKIEQWVGETYQQLPAEKKAILESTDI